MPLLYFKRNATEPQFQKHDHESKSKRHNCVSKAIHNTAARRTTPCRQRLSSQQKARDGRPCSSLSVALATAAAQILCGVAPQRWRKQCRANSAAVLKGLLRTSGPLIVLQSPGASVGQRSKYSRVDVARKVARRRGYQYSWARRSASDGALMTSLLHTVSCKG